MKSQSKLGTTFFLLCMAMGETISLILLKNKQISYNIIGFIGFICVTMGLVYLVRNKGLAVGHGIFDVSSIIFATLFGIFYLKEKTNLKTNIGLILAIISVFLLH